ncbi:MAG: ASPIC/UnbV domain-containing protein, partial [Planctomycetales bacterium]|nr:ASPIC/UnbV domain-containing protein [Planctomycetales bacterium]
MVAHAANGTPVRLIQTLNAGDAYLSQSSKWIHVGLDGTEHIDAVTVRWPTGIVEHFSGIEAGHRYDLVEESGVAVAHASRRTPAVLQVANEKTDAPSVTPRTYFSNRLPLPVLPIRSAAGNALDSESASESDGELNSAETSLQLAGRPTLLVLWASWCTPCLAELSTLAAHQAELQDADLELVAISLDGLDSEHDTSMLDAQQRLQELHWPGRSVVATNRLLRKLEFTSGMLFNRELPIQLPASILVDARGAIAAMYRGAVPFETLANDLRLLERPLNERRQLAATLGGRWLNPPRVLLLRAVAEQYERAGFTEDYQHLLARETAELTHMRQTAKSTDELSALIHREANANFELALAFVS